MYHRHPGGAREVQISSISAIPEMKPVIHFLTDQHHPGGEKGTAIKVNNAGKDAGGPLLAIRAIRNSREPPGVPDGSRRSIA